MRNGSQICSPQIKSCTAVVKLWEAILREAKLMGSKIMGIHSKSSQISHYLVTNFRGGKFMGSEILEINLKSSQISRPIISLLKVSKEMHAN